MGQPKYKATLPLSKSFFEKKFTISFNTRKKSTGRSGSGYRR
ncbi:hypothetical protein ADICYQ_2979 [Cyclobacterium qasimii M12-11B]|uniref:Uncharacterized protein n=1 Tax=Cyclobacterium qasimii M12-11B TaxID=641524 RepID=S7VED5_9BACT|nr:hypothetical protein ADICYQ_2979 [Cyclobacterium qasimii M12-11B]